MYQLLKTIDTPIALSWKCTWNENICGQSIFDNVSVHVTMCTRLQNFVKV